MKVIEAFKIALYKEIEAIELYMKLSAEYPDTKDTFEYLRGEEQKHKQFIEKKIYELSK